MPRMSLWLFIWGCQLSVFIILIGEPGTENSWGLFWGLRSAPTGTAHPRRQCAFFLSKGNPTLCFHEGLGRGSRDSTPQDPALWLHRCFGSSHSLCTQSPASLMRGSEGSPGSKLSRKLGKNSRPTRFFPGMPGLFSSMC